MCMDSAVLFSKQESNVNAPRVVTVYSIVGAEGNRANTAYVRKQDAEELGLTRAPGGRIEPVQFEVRPDQFWVGDTIAVELHRHASEDENGISTGGAWQPEVIGYADPSLVNLLTGCVDGCLRELGTDRHIQSMALTAGKQGFPYRNARLIRRRELHEDGTF